MPQQGLVNINNYSSNFWHFLPSTLHPYLITPKPITVEENYGRKEIGDESLSSGLQSKETRLYFTTLGPMIEVVIYNDGSASEVTSSSVLSGVSAGPSGIAP
jgi:hypothetical protein